MLKKLLVTDSVLVSKDAVLSSDVSMERQFMVQHVLSCLIFPGGVR